MKFEWKLTVNKKAYGRPFYSGDIKLPKEWEILDIKRLVHNVKVLLNKQLKEIK